MKNNIIVNEVESFVAEDNFNEQVLEFAVKAKEGVETVFNKIKQFPTKVQAAISNAAAAKEVEDALAFLAMPEEGNVALEWLDAAIQLALENDNELLAEQLTVLYMDYQEAESIAVTTSRRGGDIRISHKAFNKATKSAALSAIIVTTVVTGTAVTVTEGAAKITKSATHSLTGLIHDAGVVALGLSKKVIDSTVDIICDTTVEVVKTGADALNNAVYSIGENIIK